MKTIAAFSKIEDAYLVRSRLEGSGVTAFVRDEFTVAANPLYANAIGGVKVEVADEDYDRAREVLALDARAAAPGPSPPEGSARPPAVGGFLAAIVVVLIVLCVFLALG